MARGWRAAIALGLTVALAGPVATERAAAEGIASGATRLELNRGLFQALKKEDVRLTKVGTATVSGRVVKVPVSGGRIDVATAGGWIDSTEGVRFRAGRRSVRLTQLTLDTSKEVLRGVLGGQKMEIAAVPKYEFSRVGWGDLVEVSRLRLKPRVSDLLNRKLDLDLFRPGRTFGAVSSSIQPPQVQITGGSFQIGFDAGTVAKIRSLGIDLTPFEMSGAGSKPPVYTDALIRGFIDPAMARTSGAALGGIRLSSPDVPGPHVVWANLGLTFEGGKLLSAPFAQTENGNPAPIPPTPLASVDLSNANVAVDPLSRTVTVSNARATLDAAAADYINKTFAEPKGKAPVLAGGDPLGTVSMTMQGR